MRKLTEEDVINLIRCEQGEKSLRKFADEIGITASYLSDLYLGRRQPGKKILGHFGIEKKKTVTYTYERRRHDNN
ncbi:MAG TPA: hypothetical protein VFW94_24215 [Candidatus Acidoferrales bacterium]|nr:hypothetical protein [Candidatus Acidoferrales bacterium]